MEEISAGIIPTYQEKGISLFLVIKQQQGHWGFPKGHLERGEDMLAAARREVREEVGIEEVEIIPNLSHTETYFIEKDGEQVTKNVTYFLGVVKNKDVSVQKEEVSDYVWLPYKEAIERATFEGSKNALAVLYHNSPLR